MEETGPLGIAFSTRAAFSTSELAEYARRAESRGFGSVFVSERNADALALTAVLAAATTTVGVGTAITNIRLRHPALAALTVATLDEFSGGRVVLGLGTGNPGYNRSVLDDEPPPALTAMREYVSILQATLSGGPVDYEGTIYRTRGLTTHRQPLRDQVPVLIGAILPGMLRLAGEIGDGVMYALQSAEWAARSTGTVLEAAEQVGRDPAEIETSALIPTCVSADSEEAASSARMVVAGYLFHPSANRLFASMGFETDLEEADSLARAGDLAAAADAVPQAVADVLVVNGNVDACREQLDDYRRAGVRLPIAFPMELSDGGWARSVENAIALLPAD